MSNIISFDGNVTPDDDSLLMSNGGTDVLISILALSGSVIARTENEKRLMVYLLENDQIIGGRHIHHFSHWSPAHGLTNGNRASVSYGKPQPSLCAKAHVHAGQRLILGFPSTSCHIDHFPLLAGPKNPSIIFCASSKE